MAIRAKHIALFDFLKHLRIRQPKRHRRDQKFLLRRIAMMEFQTRWMSFTTFPAPTFDLEPPQTSDFSCSKIPPVLSIALGVFGSPRLHVRGMLCSPPWALSSFFDAIFLTRRTITLDLTRTSPLV